MQVFSVLTGLPEHARVPPRETLQLLHDLVSFIDVIELGLADYLDSTTRLASAKLTGGIVYDMLHAVAAEKCGASHLVTGNVRDFARLPLKKPLEIVDIASKG